MDADPRRLGYVPALDGLRGVAIALVLLYHVGWLPGGFLGVDVFFVLSGFLITTLLLEEWAKTGTVRLGAFYARRGRRLLPALLALLSILAALVSASLATGAATSTVANAITSIGATLFYCANIVRAAGHPLIGALRPMWSLAEEEQFYLLWPPLLLLLMRRGVRLRSVGMALALTALAMMVWRAQLGPGARSFFGPDTHSDPLVVGCLLAVLRHCGRLSRLGSPLVVVACGALATDVAVSGTGSFVYLVGFALAGVSTATIIAAVVDRPGLLARLLAWGPLVTLGVISYGLYVWQGLVLSIFDGLPGGRPAAIVPSVIVAVLSYRYIEQPFRRRRAARREPVVTAT